MYRRGVALACALAVGFTVTTAQARTGAERTPIARAWAWVAGQRASTGLVRSYADGTRCWTYDQALAVLAGGAVGATTTALTDGLLSLQATDGGFVESADALQPADVTRTEWTGVSAVATYALLRQVATGRATEPVTAAARRGVSWLLAQQRSDGLVGAGSPGVGWASTEHALDSWQALRLAGTALHDPAAASGADRLAQALLAEQWDDTAGRFRQGRDAAGAPDDTDPLDVNAWGAVFLAAVSRTDLARRALEHLSAFASEVDGVPGYRPYYPQAAFAQVLPNVWVEGTAGVVLARERAGDPARASTELAALQRTQYRDGAFPHALADEAATGMTRAESVAATAWYVLAATNGIWS